MSVVVRNGKVRLSGSVPTYYLKQLAQSLILPLRGVDRVDNDLAVKAAPDPVCWQTMPSSIEAQPAVLPGRSAISGLTGTEINGMSSDELIQTIRAAGLLVRLQADVERRLEFQDRQSLIRLAFMARQYCRNQDD